MTWRAVALLAAMTSFVAALEMPSLLVLMADFRL
jgi:hypothetical protein